MIGQDGLMCVVYNNVLVFSPEFPLGRRVGYLRFNDREENLKVHIMYSEPSAN